MTVLTVTGLVSVSGATSFGSDLAASGAGRFGSASMAGTTSTGALVVGGASQLDSLAVSEAAPCKAQPSGAMPRWRAR
ncbi:hypothetical protein [Cereibacter sphaeroides]|uniref:hypothetical protein n=1 Tax=Cereibacter sphaeroides TaxID=1063 RepID=UPI001F42F2AF|nr:hypothetical protein [Cereibacter sphaeroides]